MIDINYKIIFGFFTSLILTYFIIPKLIIFADRYRLSDVAGKRASHQGSTPIFGGIAIFLGILASLFVFADLRSIQFIITSLFIIFFVGMIDDLLSLNPYKKLFGQILAVLILIYLGGIKIDNMHGVLGIYEIPHVIATFFTVFVVIVIINGINLIDGVDGLAAGISIISSFCFGVIAVMMHQPNMAIIAFSLMGGLLAFLRYNLHPAKIFMGDTGSLLVGMMLSILAINLISTGVIIDQYHLPNKGPLLAIIFLAVPLFDTLRVFIVRISKKTHPLYPGREHIHHMLLELGIGHNKTSLVLCIFSILLIIISLLLLKLNINAGIAILAGISFVGLFVPFYILKSK